MSTLSVRVRAVAWAAVLAFVITTLASGAWGALLTANFKTSPAIPWAAVAMAPFLWLLWQYLGGRWWPRRTSEARRRCLRARRASGRVFAWALLTGALAVAALSGCWIVLFQLVRMTPNLLPDLSAYSLVTLVPILLMASLVAPFSEEAAFRGYAQVILERRFSGTAAVLISSLLFALAHLTQGLFWPKQLVYFLAGLLFGSIAYLTDSTLPAIPVHFLADMTFFTLVWPFDKGRRLVWDGGADAWFWLHLAQTVVFAALAVVAFRGLAHAAARERASRTELAAGRYSKGGSP
jgi:membrane protease YdiL (CAAX protease family)